MVGIAPGGAEETPLDIDSLAIVTLVTEIEASCGIRLRAGDVRRETFGTRAALRALLREKGVSC
jgi:acyl carrier protein